MKEEYWEQFMTTGRIADYLSYKAESGSSESRCLEEQKEQAGVRSGERFLHLPEGREDQTVRW